MKKLYYLLALFVCLSFVSCKKSYECHCTNMGWGMPGSYEIKALKRSSAETACDANNQLVGNDTPTGCKLK